MKRSSILFSSFLGALLISVGVVLLPRLFICDSNAAFTLGASILSGFAGCAAVIVAVLLYQNIHYSNNLQKQIDTVNSFLENLKALQIKIGVYKGADLKLYATIPVKRQYEGTHYVHVMGNQFSYPMAFLASNYYDGLSELFKLMNSIYMPPELLVKLSFLGPHVLQDANISGDTNYIKTIFNGKFEVEDKGDQMWMVIYGNESLTLDKFLQKIEELILSMVTWIQGSSGNKMNYNL
jgi:hypothetical protein